MAVHKKIVVQQINRAGQSGRRCQPIPLDVRSIFILLVDPTADDPRIIAIREFNRRLATDPRFTSMILPIRAGIAVGLFDSSV